jgi:fructosamine-3-kinase
MPAVLTHGDLAVSNVLGGSNGSLAMIDPAVSYTWAEVDPAMLYESKDQIPALSRFFDAYQELNPSPDGWRERMPILFVYELLARVAHVGVIPLPDPAHFIQPLRQILKPFYP